MNKDYNYSIVIVTYDKRYEKNLIPLIKSIKEQCENIEISLMVNGSYEEKFNEEYRKNILQFVSEYKNIYPQFYNKFTSLAKLWNRGIQNCTNKKILVLNDDVLINNGFLDLIESIDVKKLTLINNIFCHFIIDTDFLSSINWFDERFLGVGWEDLDIRNKMSHNIDNINTDLINSFHIENYSIQDQNIKYAYGDSGPSKYTKFNETFYKEKYIQNLNSESIQYPYWNFETDRYKEL